MALDVQSARKTPVTTFPAASALWFSESFGNLDREHGQFIGSFGELFRPEKGGEDRRQTPREAMQLILTPEIFTRLIRSFAGDFVSDVVSWKRKAENRLSVALRDLPTATGGKVWRMEDAFPTRIALYSPGTLDGDLVANVELVGEFRTKESNPGASITIPDSPTASEMGKTWRHRAARYFRDPDGDNDEYLPEEIEVVLWRDYTVVHNGERFGNGVGYPRLLRGGIVEATVRLVGAWTDEFVKLIDDAESGTKHDARVKWTSGGRDIILDLQKIHWRSPDRASGGGQTGPLVLEGRAETDGTADGIKISKAGF